MALATPAAMAASRDARTAENARSAGRAWASSRSQVAEITLDDWHLAMGHWLVAAFSPDAARDA